MSSRIRRLLLFKRYLDFLVDRELERRVDRGTDSMPMDRSRYPEAFDEIARRVKERADWCCEKCGRQCYRPGEPNDDRRFTLTTAHINHTPTDCSDENLIALCSGCHLEYDAPYKAMRRLRLRLLEEYATRSDRQTALELNVRTAEA